MNEQNLLKNEHLISIVKILESRCLFKYGTLEYQIQDLKNQNKYTSKIKARDKNKRRENRFGRPLKTSVNTKKSI